jgi:hypothetical protein
MNEGERKSNLLALALLAMLGMSFINVGTGVRTTQTADGERKQSSPAESQEPRGAPTQSGTADRGQEQCKAGPEPIRFLCGYFAKWNWGITDLRDDWRLMPWVREVKRRRGGLSFLLAIVPDPEGTNLELYFDRSITSIQTAVASTGYRFDRLWIPWKPAKSDSRAGTTEEARRQPGVIIFRGQGDQALIVFVIGESPISGITRLAFRNALYYMRELSPEPAENVIRIAGPNFSGSFRSLRDEMEAALQSGELRSWPRFRVISPNSTVRKEQCLFGWPAGSHGAQVTYSAILHDDDQALLSFAEYLKQTWTYPPKAVFIAEGETAYGLQRGKQESAEVADSAPAICRAPAEEPSKFLAGKALNFPRGISLLRILYPEAVRRTFTRAPGTAQDKGGGDVKLLSGGRSNMPVFAEQQTVASQEAQLLQIAQTLERDGDQIAGLAATDVLDMIFLASYFRQALPDLRLYMLDADLLMVRATSSYALDGTLLLTDFPLLPDNRVWTAAVDRTPFASRWDLSTYNAVRALLLEGSKNTGAPLLEYEKPLGGPRDRPPLWLTVVSHDSLWPVALLGGETDAAQATLQLKWPGRKDEGAAPPLMQRLSLSWRVVLVAISLLGAAFAFVLILAQLPGKLQRVEWLDSLSLGAGVPGTAGRCYYMLTGCLLLGGLLLLHLTPLMAVGRLAEAFRVYYWLPLCVVGLLGIAAFVALFRWILHFTKKPDQDSNETPRLRIHYAVLSAFAAVALTGALAAWFQAFNAESTAAGHAVFFRAYRSLHLLSGVSPVLPMELLVVALLVMLAVQLRRHNMFVKEYPFLPDADEDVFLPRIRTAQEKLWRLLGEPFIESVAARSAAGSIGLAAMVWLILRGPQSIESGAYDLLYVVLTAIAIIVTFQTWARFLLVWHELRVILDALEAHPLRDTFSSLPPEFSDVPLFGGADRYAAPAVFARSLEVLRALRKRWTPELGPFFETDEQLHLLEEKVWAYLAGGGSRRVVDHELKLTADKLLRWLEGHWRQGQSAREAKKEGETTVQTLAAEFIALRYTAYIRHVMLHMRNLLYFVTLGFFLTLTSGLVYPFRSQNLLGWAATGSFILFGLPVGVVLVQMDRNRLLRRLRSSDGSAGSGRYLLRALVLGVPPLVALVGTHFPAVSRYLSDWLAPALQALSK